MLEYNIVNGILYISGQSDNDKCIELLDKFITRFESQIQGSEINTDDRNVLEYLGYK